VTHLVIQDRRYPATGSGLKQLACNYYAVVADITRCKDTFLRATAPGNGIFVDVRMVWEEFLTK
jgi:hypothetical protein